jgi:hypothetical protein
MNRIVARGSVEMVLHGNSESLRTRNYCEALR